MTNIGDFERTEVSGEDAIKAFAGGAEVSSMAPKEEEKREEAPATDPETVQQQADRANELEGLLGRFEQSPELTYEARLKEHGVTMEEAMDIVNGVLDNNFYEKEYSVTSRHSVTFRTRLASDQDVFLKKMEDKNPRYAPTIAHDLSKHNLAASVVRFKGVDFSEKEYKEKYEFFNQMSEVLLRLLASKLHNFEQLVADVLLDEGAIANF